MKTLLENLSNLLKVKSIITLAIILTTCYLVVEEKTIDSNFLMMASAIITYFFTKVEKPEVVETKTLAEYDEYEVE